MLEERGGRKRKMEITYIGHSGFLVELSSLYLLFDYYEGKLPELKPEKPVFLFASHFHQDHFNPQVFKLLAGQEKVYGIFSKDIFESRTPQDMEKWFVVPEQTYELPLGVCVETLRSTDKGVAFLIGTQEAEVYHGGDLNDWVWEGEKEQENRSMTGRYQKEIRKLAEKSMDVAFVPLDPRQGAFFDRGMEYFLEHTKARLVVPMHFWKQPDIIERFLGLHPEWKDRVLPMCYPLEQKRTT